MTLPIRQSPRTASQDRSIWQPISEETFRLHVVELEKCTNAVPIGPEKFPSAQDVFDPVHGNDASSRLLPLAVEQRLATDVAALVAVEPGAQSVAAVCIEERFDRKGMVIRVAAIDAIDEPLQKVLQTIFELLALGSRMPHGDTSIEDSDVQPVFELIVAQHRARILGRLRSSKWVKPNYLSRSHKKPLWQDFDNLSHRVQFLYTRAEKGLRKEIEGKLNVLAGIYKAFEFVEGGPDDEDHALEQLIKSSYSFCTSSQMRCFAHRLNSMPKATTQVSAALKSLQQIEKIAAYWSTSQSLVNCSRSFPSVFGIVLWEYLVPYAPTETTVAYESWAKSCHVHAEVQMAVYYDGREGSLVPATQFAHHPRCIGTSKYLCYLCYLFLHERNLRLDQCSPSLGYVQLHLANTHGRLYDQWTIPDLATFDIKTVNLYRHIIEDMTRAVQTLTQQTLQELEQEQSRLGEGRGNGKSRTIDGRLVKWRAEPMTSRENLLLVEDEA